MEIHSIEVEERLIPLAKTFRTSLRETDTAREIMVKVRSQSGLCGYGAACPVAEVTGESTAGVRQIIEDRIAPAIYGMSLQAMASVCERIQRVVSAGNSAKAAVDMALYDLWAQYLGKPLYQLLGGYRHMLQTNLTLSMDTPENMAAEARRAVATGFTAVKVKLGSCPREDLTRVAMIREAVGEDVALCLDANQAWKPREAVQLINKIEKYRPELVEQPVAAWDIAGLHWVSDRVNVPIMVDESLFSARDALKLLTLRGIDYVNIKLLKCGGIHEALKICAIAEAAGIECMVGSMLEGPVSVTAAIHFAASQKIVTRVDLDSLFFLETKYQTLPGISYGPQITIENDCEREK